MGRDCYLVEVLHYLNPHLIWVEVVDSKDEDFVFEQIGVYGIIPYETTLDAAEGGFKTQQCSKWVQAASVIMKKALSDAKEIWFCPTHIDRRSSIFDDNIHKFGELIIIKKNDKVIELSKALTQSGFAMTDICQFHKELSLGNLKTKLNYNKTQEIIKHLEKSVSNKSNQNHRSTSVKKQTEVFQAAQNLESTLTTTNIERHNRLHLSGVKVDKLMQMKIKDFDKCKDVDEVSVGRASNVKTKRSEHEETKPKNLPAFLQKKLNMNRKPKPKQCNNVSQILMATKQYLENNAITKCSDSSKSETTSDNKKQELGQEMQENDLKQNINQTILNEVKKPGPVMVDKEIMTRRGIFYRSKPRKVIRNAQNEVIYIRKIGVGPPEVNFQSLHLNPVTGEEQTNENEEQTNEKLVSNEEVKKEEMKTSREMIDEVDSNINLEITNKEYLKESLKETAVDKDGKVDCNKESSLDINNSVDVALNESNSSADSKSNVEMNTKFAVMQKKLSLFRNIKPKREVSSSSDSTYKDSSSEKNEKQKTDKKTTEFLDSDDDTITNLVEKISLEYPPQSLKDDAKPKEIVKATSSSTHNNVNPFKNVDSNISVFVEKLVSPVLMVHSKINKRIEPCSNIRDVNFNTHIHVVLKNMNIDRPMMLQMISWPVILRGFSFFMIGPKHSGKTIGYLPAVCRLISDFKSEFVDSVGPTCIIVCATAESVSEVENLAKMFLGLEEKVLACYPGMEDLHVTTSLLNGCDLFICTPSILVRLLQLTDFGIDLRRLSTFVLEDCERLSEVYVNEVKFFLIKIKEMLKNRANKELKVQFIVLSRVWCDFLEPLAKKAPNSVICIGAFQECVLYSKANTAVDFVKRENKQNKVLEFLKEIDTTKRTVIVCRSDDEVAELKNGLMINKYVVFACDNTMTVEDLYNLNKVWDEYQEPLLGPILICCDGNLNHLNITNAHHLIHYSLPRLFSMFCKRFSVLNDNYPSIFKAENETVKIKVFLEETNVEQLPKILNFIKRCTDNIPEFLDKVCKDILIEKDAIKAKNLVPICCNVLELGECPDFWNCQDRHAVFENSDKPKNWMPKNGVVTFKILHYLTPIHYSVRLLSNISKGHTEKYPQAYSTLSLKMGMYFSKESNRKLHGIPKVGDVCAVSVKLNFFVRCQVLKILSKYNNGTPNCVLIKLIDEEKLEKSRDIYLFHLPEELKKIETHIVQVRLANICPRDKDITFSNHAKEMLKKITKQEEDLYFRGQVVLTVGNCIFIDTLEACQELTSLNETVVRYNLKKELLETHAIANPDHMVKLEKLCASCIDNNKDDTDALVSVASDTPKKEKVKPQWAHLENKMTLALFASAEDPGTFFLRLTKFESCMKLLLKDIEKHMKEKPEMVEHVSKNDIVLAKFPDDSTYERARVEEVLSANMVKCFFVDQGDWRDVFIKDLAKIPNRLINQMPFQAIECRLIGVKPVGDNWTDYGTNWFCDQCFESDSGKLKHLYVQYFTKEKAHFTGGNKYGVAIIDTYGEEDVVINSLMIDLNLAQENEEISYLGDLKLNKHRGTTPEKEMSDDSFEEIPEDNSYESKALVPVKEETPKVSLDNVFMRKPVRSVPLVDSDAESDGSWSICYAHDFLPGLNQYTSDLKTKNVAQDEKPTTKTPNSTKNDTTPPFVKITKEDPASKTDTSLTGTPAKSACSTLDSDDLSSAESTQVSEKIIKTEFPVNLIKVDELRKPKLCWRQNKSSVSIKIQLIGVDDYDLEVKDRTIKFSAYTDDTKYGFDFELYGVVNNESVVHSNKGQYILVKFNKVIKKNWLSLAKDVVVRKWIVYDVDSIDTSSEEEEDFRDTLADVMKNIHNKGRDSESDEDFLDDIGYEYKRDSD